MRHVGLINVWKVLFFIFPLPRAFSALTISSIFVRSFFRSVNLVLCARRKHNWGPPELVTAASSNIHTRAYTRTSEIRAGGFIGRRRVSTSLCIALPFATPLSCANCEFALHALFRARAKSARLVEMQGFRNNREDAAARRSFGDEATISPCEAMKHRNHVDTMLRESSFIASSSLRSPERRETSPEVFTLLSTDDSSASFTSRGS